MTFRNKSRTSRVAIARETWHGKNDILNNFLAQIPQYEFSCFSAKVVTIKMCNVA